VIREPVLLVGCGTMAQAYARVLSELGVRFIAVGRGRDSADMFEREIGVAPITGGIDAALESLESTPRAALVAVDIPNLAAVTRALVARDVRRILLEKPGGITPDEVESLAHYCAEAQVQVYIAYNRRFYESVRRAGEIISQDGGVTSLKFDFTELGGRVDSVVRSAEIKRNWFYANSTHVVDLAFHLAGAPVELAGSVTGNLPWHPAGAVFVGSGRTERGALFSYHADWSAPGRWLVEVMTANHRLILQPLEALQVQRHESMKIERVALADERDRQFKPGLYRQVAAFLSLQANDALLPLGEHIKHHLWYSKMLNPGVAPAARA
jgi:predicted dehydrogenase